jgi:hypothetical protein
MHCKWFGRVLIAVYIKHKISYIIIMKVECIRTGRTNECGVFNELYETPFGNWPKECIFDRDLLGPRNRYKRFNLSMCNRIMWFALHR